MLSRFVIPFLPRSKCLSISWLQSPTHDFVAQENKNLSLFLLFSIYLLWIDGSRCHDLSYLNVEFQASFFTLFFHLQEALHFLPLGWCHLRLLIFLLAILSRIRATKLHHWTQNWKEMRKTILMSWHRQIQYPTSYIPTL